MSETTVSLVFACKSNSCRSQMAEGWALQYFKENEEYQKLLSDGKLIVMSVALDADAVYTDKPDADKDVEEKSTEQVVAAVCEMSSYNTNSCETCCGDTVRTLHQRKEVKQKAIEAMALDGVDISHHRPKIWKEILPLLRKQAVDGAVAAAVGGNPNEDNEELISSIDKLVVLCSCGVDTMDALRKMSKSVEVWNVDAPTAASKGLEGESAYRRVSLEIKERVNTLINDMIVDRNLC